MTDTSPVAGEWEPVDVPELTWALDKTLPANFKRKARTRCPITGIDMARLMRYANDFRSPRPGFSIPDLLAAGYGWLARSPEGDPNTDPESWCPITGLGVALEYVLETADPELRELAAKGRANVAYWDAKRRAENALAALSNCS